MARTIETHYDNLRVLRDAPVDVIKKSYRKLSQKYHPDRNAAPDALRIMKLINLAWDVLSDPQRRARHDRWIANEEMKLKLRAPVRPAARTSAPRTPVAGAATARGRASARKRTRAHLALALLAFLVGGAVIYAMQSAEQPEIALAAPASASETAKPVVEPESASPRLPHGYLRNDAQDFSSGMASLDIDNTKGTEDIEVHLYRDSRQVRTLGVHHGRQFVIDELPFGIYVVKYKTMVDGKARIYESANAFVLKPTKEEARQHRYDKHSKARARRLVITGDNARVREIPPDQFLFNSVRFDL